MDGIERNVIEISVRRHGAVPDDQVQYAREAVGHVLGHVGEPVLEVRVTLTVLKDSIMPNPAQVQILVVLKGRSVRAHAASPAIHETIRIACDRLAIRLERVARDWESARGRSHTAPGAPTC